MGIGMGCDGEGGCAENNQPTHYIYHDHDALGIIHGIYLRMNSHVKSHVTCMHVLFLSGSQMYTES